MMVSQNNDINCLAINKLKARIVKDKIIKDKLSYMDTSIANKIIKYKTLLSQQMLKSVKTQELQDFKRQVQDYVSKEYTQYDKILGRYEDNNEKLNIHDFIHEIKQSTKISIKNQKYKTHRSLTKQKSLVIKSFKINKTQKIISNKTKEKQNQIQIIPLGNSKIKEAFQYNKYKQDRKQETIIGQCLSDQFVNFLEKLDKLDEKPEKQIVHLKKDAIKDQEGDEQILGPCKLLKKESQRLKSSFQVTNYKKLFLPLGKIKKTIKEQLKTQNYLLKNKQFERTYGSIGKGRCLKAIVNKNRFEIQQLPSKQIRNNILRNSHIKLQEGLPKSIQDIIPIKRNKKDSINQHSLYKNQINSPFLSQKQAVGLEITEYFPL